MKQESCEGRVNDDNIVCEFLFIRCMYVSLAACSWAIVRAQAIDETSRKATISGSNFDIILSPLLLV